MTRLFRLSFVLLFVLAFGAVSVASAQSTTTWTSPFEEFSVRLPTGWVTEIVDVVPDYSDAFAFGSSQQDLQDAYNLLIFGTFPNQLPRLAGMIGILDPAQIGTQQLDRSIAPVLQFLLGQFQAQGAQVLGTPETTTLGGLYPAQVVDTSFGVLAVMSSTERLMVVIILTDNAAADFNAVNDILNSIRIPPEDVAPITPEPVPSEEVSPVTPEPAPSQEVTPGGLVAPQTVRSSDMRVSLVIPSGWTVLDHVAEQNILAYGDSSDAAQSRLHAAMPDLAPDTAITGNGGLIILYPMAQFGIDPANPDLSGLMERALAGLTGYTVQQQATPFDGGFTAVISGAETGFLALIPFDDQIAYVTATSATAEQFELDDVMLMDIIDFVHVPAELEPTPTPTPAGLGGLGGLTEATAEATAEGLGGLGGLGGAATATPTPAGLGGLGEATPEATAES